MTSQEIMKKIEDERVKQGITCAEMDSRTWHTDGCYWKTKDSYTHGGGAGLRNLIRYAEVLGLELHIRKKVQKDV
jgi:hypothetical protein